MFESISLHLRTNDVSSFGLVCKMVVRTVSYGNKSILHTGVPCAMGADILS